MSNRLKKAGQAIAAGYVVFFAILAGLAFCGELPPPMSQRDRAIALCTSGDERLAGMESAKALEAFDKAWDMFQALAAENPDDVQARHDISVTLMRIADVYVQMGEGQKALEAYEKSLALNRETTLADPDNLKYGYGLYVAQCNLADLKEWLGNGNEALDAYTQALNLAKKMAASGETDVQTHLFVTLTRIQALYSRLGVADEAASFKARGEAVYESMMANDGQAWAALSKVFDEWATRYLMLRQPKAAVAALEQAVEINRRQAQAHPDEKVFPRNMSAYLRQIGGICIRMGAPGRAVDVYARDLSITRSLAQSEPDSILAQRAMAASFDSLGDALLQSGRTEDARDIYDQARQIVRKLSAAHPDSVDVKQDQIIGLYKLGRAHEALHAIPSALESYRTALDLAREAGRQAPENPLFQNISRDLKAAVSRLEDQ